MSKRLIILTFLLVSSLIGKSQIFITTIDQISCYGSSNFFTSTSSPQAISWLWHFGDGDTSSLENPTHLYQTSNSFNGKLIASDGTSTDSVFFTVTIVPTPDVNFGHTANGLTINFYDSTTISTGTFNWLWTFGDGNTSNIQNPIHNYLSIDTCYDVSLTVPSNAGCINILTMVNYICITTDVKEVTNKNIKVYPTPLCNNQSQLHINGELIGLNNVIGYDILGKPVQLPIVSKTSTELILETNHLSKGSYILKILFEDNTQITKKIIVQ